MGEEARGAERLDLNQRAADLQNRSALPCWLDRKLGSKIPGRIGKFAGRAFVGMTLFEGTWDLVGLFTCSLEAR